MDLDAKAKTPVALLQEMAVRAGDVPEYQFVGQIGPPHMPMFRYSCSAFGHQHIGVGACKRTAKHEAAAGVLAKIKCPSASVPAARTSAPPLQHVALLAELCMHCRLPAPQYHLVSDTGPPHSRRFEMRASVGAYSRTVAAPTKKEARRQAAAELYRYLRRYLPQTTAHFSEEQAMENALATAMSSRGAREAAVHSQAVWRPALDLLVRDYHISLPEAAKAAAATAAAEAALAASGDNGELADHYKEPDLKHAERAAATGDWADALDSLRLPYDWNCLETVQGGGVVAVLIVERTTPALTFTGLGSSEEVSRQVAGARAARYIATMLADVN